MTKILTKLKGATLRIPTRNECLHRSYKSLHTGYFMLLALEEHGFIAFAGAGLVAFSILDFFLHFEGET